MITTHMIEASAMGLTDRLPAYAHLWNATFATAVRNAFGAVSFTYFETREAAIADAAAWGSGAAEVVPATRRLRNQAEIDRLTADAEAGDVEAGAFVALWASILRTAGKSAGATD